MEKLIVGEFYLAPESRGQKSSIELFYLFEELSTTIL